MLLILLIPIDSRACLMNNGESLMAIPLISLPVNWVHFSVALPTVNLVLKVSNALKSGIFTFLSKIAPTSLAML